MSKKVSQTEHKSYYEPTLRAKRGGSSKKSTMTPAQRRKQRLELIKKRLDEKKKRETETLENSMSNCNDIFKEAERSYYDFIYQRNKGMILKGAGNNSSDSSSSSSSYGSSSGSTSSNISYSSNVALSSDEKQYSGYILKYSEKYNLDPNLVAAVITKESGWDPGISSKGVNCQGLMQVNPRFHSGNLFDPEHNIATGCKILRECLDAYPTLDQALVAYNAGIKGAEKIPSSEYSQKVITEYNKRLDLLDDGANTSSISYYA